MFTHIAPCGMNCLLCIAYQRKKNKCSGCRGVDDHKPSHCKTCRIKLCRHLPHGVDALCYACEKFPCLRLKDLDARYRKKYHMSMIENLSSIKENGITRFDEMQYEKWTCSKCGSLLCVHRDACQQCGEKYAVDDIIKN